MNGYLRGGDQAMMAKRQALGKREIVILRFLQMMADTEKLKRSSKQFMRTGWRHSYSTIKEWTANWEHMILIPV